MGSKTARGPWNINFQLKEGKELLDKQPDFAAQQECWPKHFQLRDISDNFYPKFHPEFNWIEIFGGSKDTALTNSKIWKIQFLLL